MAKLQKTVPNISLTKSTSKRKSKGIGLVGKITKTKEPKLEDINILLRLSELYNTTIDFEAAEWFWSKMHKDEIPSSIQEFENKYLKAGQQRIPAI